jgi:hypothetical protein
LWLQLDYDLCTYFAAEMVSKYLAVLAVCLGHILAEPLTPTSDMVLEKDR